MIHRGEIVEKAVRKSGISVAEIARRMNKSRRHIYNLFEKPDLSTDVILQIGRIIHYNFTEEIKDNVFIESEMLDRVLSVVNESGAVYEVTQLWKEKYIDLLEKYNKLLMDYLKLIKEEENKT